MLSKIWVKRAKPARAEGTRELQTLASGAHLAPGDAGWPLLQIVPAPKSAEEGEAVRGYLRQLRECVQLIEPAHQPQIPLGERSGRVVNARSA